MPRIIQIEVKMLLSELEILREVEILQIEVEIIFREWEILQQEGEIILLEVLQQEVEIVDTLQ